MILSKQFTRPLLTFLFVISAGLAGLTGCDTVDDLRTQDVSLDLGQAGTIPLVSGANAKTDSVSGSQDIPGDAFKVQSVSLKKNNVSYQPSALKKALDSGNASVYLIVERVPIVGADITIEEDEVTTIDPTPISIGDGLSGLGNCASGIERDFYDDGDFSDSKRESTLRSAIKQDSFSLTVAACVSDGLMGTLSVDRASVEVKIGG